MPRTTAPEHCTRCPHIDTFHSTCSHPLRQLVIQEIRDGHTDCPLYPGIRSQAMGSLIADLERTSLTEW